MSVNTKEKSLIIQAKRQYVLDVVSKLLKDFDWDELSMDDMASAAGHTKKTLYAYFQSKEDMLLSLVIQELKDQWDFQKDELVSASNGMEQLILWSYTLFDYQQINPHSHKLYPYIRYFSLSQEDLNEENLVSFNSLLHERKQVLNQIFESGMKDGSIRDDVDQAMLIDQFVESYDAILYKAFSKTRESDFDRSIYVNHFLKLFITNLGPSAQRI